MGAMNEFLRWVRTPEAVEAFELANQRTAEWAAATNRRFAEAALPLRIVHLGTIWTIEFTEPGRYNWLLQYYVRAEGVTLSWVGTGRCLFSLDFRPEDYEELTEKLVAAGSAMKQDAWWLSEAEQPGRSLRMKLRLARELLGSLVRVPQAVTGFYREVMRRKHDDHVASHSNFVNQVGHLLSSSAFIGCYFLVFRDYVSAMCIGLAALFIRQIGHAIFEPPCHDKEELLLGFTTRSKTLVVAGYLLIPIAHVFGADSLSAERLWAMIPEIALQWLALTGAVVFGHVGMLVFTHGLRNALIWLVKLVTDPFTDLVAYAGPVSKVCRGWLSGSPQQEAR
jgi:glutamate-1-semialdehyde 2,1-aminomutase